MKLIFLFLMLANGSFFIYHYWAPGDSSSLSNNGAVNEMDSGRGLVLLSESPSVSSVKTVDYKKRVGSSSGGAGNVEGEQLCTMLGPYEQLLQAEYATEQLHALGVDAQIESIQIKQGEVFWVYLAPEVSGREAMSRLFELQKKGIESHLITRGELANGISLGRLTSIDEANNLVAQIAAQGYTALVKAMSKTIQEMWIVMGDDFAAKIDESVWVRLMSQQKGLEKRQNFCLGVASR